MEWGFLFFFNSILLGVGLAMDAFSVSLANGLLEPQMKNSRMLCISGVYAVFQFLMPLIGWILVHTAASYFTVMERFIPWISLGLLGYLGIKMVLEGTGKEDAEKPGSRADEAKTPTQKDGEETASPQILGSTELKRTKSSVKVIGLATLFVQGIATSIDALSVGFTIADYDFFHAITAVTLIGGVTWGICYLGLAIGKKFGLKFSRHATIFGGLILIGIGIEIFVTRIFGL